MRYKIIIAIVSIFLYNNICANPTQNNNFRLEINAPFFKGSTVYFANYWKGDSYIVDSTLISNDGVAVFVKPEKLATGQYLLYIKPDVRMELLIDNAKTQNVKLLLDKQLTKSTVEGSDDTKLFWNYLLKTEKLNEQINSFIDKLSNAQLDLNTRKNTLVAYSHVLEKLDQLTKNDIQEHQGSWFSCFLKANQTVKLPFAQPQNKEESAANRVYLRNHYFDNMDFTDVRLWNTSFFVPKMENYINEVIPQSIDTIAKETSWLVKQTVNNDKAFELMLSHFFNEASTSKVMGMENVWAKLCEDYIFDKNIAWIDSVQYNNLLAEYALIKENRIGMVAQNLMLQTISNDTINTNDIDVNFTVLYFYSPTCSHCDKEIPLLRKELYPKYKDKGLNIVAINIDRNIETWQQFVDKHNMNIEGWFNLFDPDFQSEYWLKYDVSGTPSLYLLGKDKGIIAKKIDVHMLETLLGRITE